MKLVSACLLGITCTWDCSARYKNDKVIRITHKETLIPICPEQLGGLPTPRSPQYIQNGTGEDVLDTRGIVVNKLGENVTEQFVRGAKETLKIARMLGVKEFIAKSNSPSCGCGQIYTETGLRKGDGVATALLKRNGIKVINEKEL